MKRSNRTPPSGGVKAPFTALLVTNAGVLLVLLCGPNSLHPVGPLAYGGAAIALAGLFVLVRSVIVRRRNAPF